MADEKSSEEKKPFVGRYEIHETVSIRDQATVFRAFDPDLQRFVSLKLYHGHSAQTDEGETHRIFNEGRALASVESPYVARCHNVETLDDTPVLVNEWIDGQTLEEYFADHELTYQQVESLFRKIATGIGAIHKKGLLHRDIKPSNIIVDSAGEPKVIDLGLAESDSHLKPQLAGTPAFVAPEVMRGDIENIGPQTDIFGLGGVLFYLLTGQAVYEADSKTGVLEKASIVEVRRSSEVAASFPNRLDRICDKCLAEDPADRFQSVEELLGKLNHSNRNKWLAAAGVLVMVAGLAIYVFFPPSYIEPESTPNAGTNGSENENNDAVPPTIELSLFERAEAAALNEDFDKAIELAEDNLETLGIGDADDAIDVGTVVTVEEAEDVRTLFELINDCYLQMPDFDGVIDIRQRRLAFEESLDQSELWAHDAEVELAEAKNLKALQLSGEALGQFVNGKRMQFKGERKVQGGRRDTGGSVKDLQSAVNDLVRSAGEDNFETVICKWRLSKSYFVDDQRQMCGRILDAIEVDLQRIYGRKSGQFALFYENRAELRRAVLGQPDRALPDIDKSIAMVDELYGPESPKGIARRCNRCSILLTDRKFQEAKDGITALMPKLKQMEPTWVHVMAFNCLATTQLALGQLDECQATLGQLQELAKRIDPKDQKARRQMGMTQLTVIDLASRQGKAELVTEIQSQLSPRLDADVMGREMYGDLGTLLAVFLARVGETKMSTLEGRVIIDKLDPVVIDRAPRIAMRYAEILIRANQANAAQNWIERTLNNVNFSNFHDTAVIVEVLTSISTVDETGREMALTSLKQLKHKLSEKQGDDSITQYDRLAKMIDEAIETSESDGKE